MDKWLKYLAATAAAVLSMVGGAHLAFAETMAGYSGAADNQSQATSFSANWNGVQYNGSGTARWDMPLPTANYSNTTPTAYLYNNGTAPNISCSVQAVYQTGVSATAWSYVTSTNTWTTLAPGTVTVPTNGSLEMACYIGNGSVISGVSYSGGTSSGFNCASGYLGSPDAPSLATSFSEAWNAVKYNGTGTARWDIPLFAYATYANGYANLSPVVAAYANGAKTNVSCSTQAVNTNSNTYHYTSWTSPGSPNIWTTFTPGNTSVLVPLNGTMEVACFLGNGSEVQSVFY